VPQFYKMVPIYYIFDIALYKVHGLRCKSKLEQHAAQILQLYKIIKRQANLMHRLRGKNAALEKIMGNLLKKINISFSKRFPMFFPSVILKHRHIRRQLQMQHLKPSAMKRMNTGK